MQFSACVRETPVWCVLAQYERSSMRSRCDYEKNQIETLFLFAQAKNEKAKLTSQWKEWELERTNATALLAGWLCLAWLLPAPLGSHWRKKRREEKRREIGPGCVRSLIPISLSISVESQLTYYIRIVNCPTFKLLSLHVKALFPWLSLLRLSSLVLNIFVTWTHARSQHRTHCPQLQRITQGKKERRKEEERDGRLTHSFTHCTEAEAAAATPKTASLCSCVRVCVWTLFALGAESYGRWEEGRNDRTREQTDERTIERAPSLDVQWLAGKERGLSISWSN